MHSGRRGVDKAGKPRDALNGEPWRRRRLKSENGFVGDFDSMGKGLAAAHDRRMNIRSKTAVNSD